MYAPHLSFQVEHVYAALCVWVFVDQLGVPIPVVPLLTLVGALSKTGHVEVVPAILAGAAATVLSDEIWYEIGRRRGAAVLSLACRLSMAPGSCIGRTERVFTRFGLRSLLVGKFLPGFNAVAAPMAGHLGVGRLPFAACSALGAVLWCGTFIGLGRYFSDQVEGLTDEVLSGGPWLLVSVALCLAGFLWVKRWRCKRESRNAGTPGIVPEDAMSP